MKKFTILRFLATIIPYVCSILAVCQLHGASITASVLRTAGPQVGRVTRVYFSPARPAYASGSRSYSGVGVGVGGRFGSELGTLSFADIRKAIPAVAPNWQELRSRFKGFPQQSMAALRSTFERKPQPQAGYSPIAINQLIDVYRKKGDELYRQQDELRGRYYEVLEELDSLQPYKNIREKAYRIRLLERVLKHIEQQKQQLGQDMVANDEAIQELKQRRFEAQRYISK